MAAIITPTNLTIIEHSALKHPPSAAEPTCPLPPLPTALTWSTDNNSVYLSSATSGILQYDLASGSLQDVSVHDQSSHPVVALLSKDRGSTLICARGQQATVLSSQAGKVAHTFDTHKATITSLSLSNDCTLLASTSAHAIHVHNLTLASHTVLRGIPAGSGDITTCAFHPHSRTRLLVGRGTQLLVYDTTRPSGPAKVIPLDKEQKKPGCIVSISCSPFSKTLVAIACSGGMVTLIDLEKEKGLFRSVVMPAPVTCLSFSAEGAAVYAGTENGKLLILDLRALDKPPKTISVSENGDQVIAISVQRKLKPGEAQAAKPVPTAAAKPLVQRDTNKAAPAARRIGSSTGLDAAKKAVEDKVATKKSSAITSTTPARRTTTRTASNPSNGSPAPRPAAAGARRFNAGTVTSPVAGRAGAQKATFSPPRSPVTLSNKKDDEEEDGELSVRVENLLALPRAKEPAATVVDDDEAPITVVPTRASTILSRASSRGSIGQPPRSHARTESASRAYGGLAAGESQSQSASAAHPRVRSASSGSTASRASKTSVASTRRIVSGSGSSSSKTSSASPPAGVGAQRRRVSGSSLASRISRSPSPDLPGTEEDGGPVTPIPAHKRKGKGKERTALGVLGTPEIDEWVRAGEGKGKAAGKEGRRVGFAGDSESESEAEEIARAGASADSDEELDARAPTSANARLPPAAYAMQVSPRRSFAGLSPSARRAAWAPVPSPLRNPGAPPSPQARAAQDMLQALMRDALYDFRQETKAEIVGLHLDLIRMGTGWRTEMREAMGEVAEEIRALREENRRLREENERLRRGY
ncbi:WD40 repeat-like protein [Dichomitus squalens LYAD-421 SS1]|uniref:WD40 repeat-like protein n=1 Tax=Dichomitus squalens (strain LYAD-421) TaxID=732165 RepID=UPI00044132BF|nr:WD40 repeat-like protein [Dichomitus squalens LYAD-421 SS1]EJF66116.1 WD40 repeat-like protein [Dichomitus squalens LYAD-421 SS1]